MAHDPGHGVPEEEKIIICSYKAALAALEAAEAACSDHKRRALIREVRQGVEDLLVEAGDS